MNLVLSFPCECNLLGLLTMTLNPAVLNLFISFDPTICSASDFNANSDQFPLTSNSKGDSAFDHKAFGYSCADRGDIGGHVRDVPWDDIFKLDVSTAAAEFCEWIQVGIDIYNIPHC